jgi:hypothetical protein
MSTIKSSGENLKLSSDNTKDIELQHNGTTNVTLKSDGKLGVGTASPDALLEIEGSGGSNYVYITNKDASDVDGNRHSKLYFRGVQSGGERSNLASIQTHHDGSADDQKGILSFRTNDGSDGNSPTEKLRILSSGGITFNGDTATANALDDYEEGTWTPVITASSGTITSYVVPSANYTKIGRLCTASIYYYVSSNGTGSGYSKFTLPFTSSSINGHYIGAGREVGHTGHGLTGDIGGSATFAAVRMSKDGSYPINGGYNKITISYITA